MLKITLCLKVRLTVYHAPSPKRDLYVKASGYFSMEMLVNGFMKFYISNLQDLDNSEDSEEF